MENTFKNTTRTMVKKNFSNVWFIVSVLVTVFLIALLVWSLTHSYRTLETFESESLALERASGELLLHTKTSEMSVQIATATGDLRWQESYDLNQPKVEKILYDIPKIIDSSEANQEVKNIQNHLNEIRTLEKEAFELVSHGKKEEASALLSGWEYTKNQLELTESITKLTETMSHYTNERLLFEERLTLILLIIVVVSLIILIFSWVISVKIWQTNFKKIQEKEDEITYLSYHDSLTGLYNRRYFESEFVRLNVKRQLPLTIIICDANGLKRINDTLGHNVGDELLIEIARILKKAVREEDIVSRWGGDEFGLILPKSNADVAEKIITRINEACENSQFEATTPSISVGYAVKTETSQSIDNIFANAESRMYKKKKQYKKNKRIK